MSSILETANVLNSLMGRVDYEKEVQITLTKSQCKNVAEFIEFYLFDIIRTDTGIDNINYLIDMCEAYKVLKMAYKGGNDND